MSEGRDIKAIDGWRHLRTRTPARIAIGRSGASLPTREVLDFSLAHAMARDAVAAEFDRDQLSDSLNALGLKSLRVDSQATDHSTYLRRPDLGRRLNAGDQENLSATFNGAHHHLTLVIGDGLSARAVNTHAAPLLVAILPHIEEANLSLAPVVLAKQARVALGDEIGALMNADLVAVIIGERPGLSAADCLSIYLTWHPKIGRTDAERNCISNIAFGRLEPKQAADRLMWLIRAARQRKLTGVALKDESDALTINDQRSRPALDTSGH